MSVIDPATDSVVGSVEVGTAAVGHRAHARRRGSSTRANGPSNDVSVVDADELTVIKKIPVGKIPWGVAIGQAP